ncbi:MAG: hypothetical protein WA960_22510 [Tunicatimonas sp.]
MTPRIITLVTILFLSYAYCHHNAYSQLNSIKKEKIREYIRSCWTRLDIVRNHIERDNNFRDEIFLNNLLDELEIDLKAGDLANGKLNMRKKSNLLRLQKSVRALRIHIQQCLIHDEYVLSFNEYEINNYNLPLMRINVSKNINPLFIWYLDSLETSESPKNIYKTFKARYNWNYRFHQQRHLNTLVTDSINYSNLNKIAYFLDESNRFYIDNEDLRFWGEANKLIVQVVEDLSVLTINYRYKFPRRKKKKDAWSELGLR